MALVSGIHHYSMRCFGEEQYEKTIDFYQNLLGLSVRHRWEKGCLLDTGSGIVEIFPNAEKELPDGTIQHVAFACEDVDGTVEAVRKAGYMITKEPTDVVVGGAIPARIAFFRGPVGESVELFHEKRPEELR